MKIVCVGGGPAGLYFGLLMKKRHPGHEVVVVERNRAYDTFGWGVVFSDATMGALQRADPSSAKKFWVLSIIGMTSRSTSTAPRTSPVAMAFAVSDASVCSIFFNAVVKKSVWSWCLRPKFLPTKTLPHAMVQTW